MRSLIILFITFLISTCTYSQWTNKTRILPDELRKIPETIFIRHSPNPVYPEQTISSDQSEYKYVWRHSTSVTSITKEHSVVRAGSYIWYNEEGWKQNVILSKKDFQKKFKCRKGKLKKGITYTYEQNYRWGHNTFGGDALWYVLAEDDSGKLYKAISIIETESETKTPKQ